MAQFDCLNCRSDEKDDAWPILTLMSENPNCPDDGSVIKLLD